MKKDIKVTITYVNKETGERSDKPFPEQLERLKAAIEKNLKKDIKT